MGRNLVLSGAAKVIMTYSMLIGGKMYRPTKRYVAFDQSGVYESDSKTDSAVFTPVQIIGYEPYIHAEPREITVDWRGKEFASDAIEMISVDDVKARVAEIAAIDHDDEEMHGKEDALHVDVLRAIADGAPNASDLAREALNTCDIRFNRWYC